VTAVRCAAPGCASFDNSVRGAVTDETKVAYIVLFRDANRTVQGGGFSPCSTVYAGGFNLVPGASYTIVYKNPSGSTLRAQSVTADNAGSLADSYAFTAAAPAGVWTVLLRDAGGNDLDSAVLSLQRSASLSVQPAALGAPLSGGTLAASSQFSNSNSQAGYASSRVDYVVKNPAGSQYLDAGGFFTPYASGSLTASHGPFDVSAGASSSDSFAVPSVTFPDYGIYSVCATWESSCGSSSSSADDLASSCSSLYVVSWLSFADAGRTVPASTFEAPATAYLQGEGYGNALSYVVALYAPSGGLLSTAPVTSTSGGFLSSSAATASLPGVGTYHAAVYLNAASVPAAYASGDPAMLADLAFDVTLSAPVLAGPVMDGATSVSGSCTAPAGSVVTLFVNGIAAGTAAVQAGGGFTVTPGSAFSAGEVLTASVQVGTVTSTLSAPITVSPPVSLLRAGVVTQLSPQSPPNSSIFYQTYPSDPALDPSVYTEQAAFASGASFPHESTDLQAASAPLIFYELSGNSGATLRVAKSGGKIVITY
jgi:hypothetical protein